ncbi:hypothetical protein, unlikely [Trypanosoma brucei gambiense DAL972]|uniref:Uncharacterized protein n=1 Tax=Trypanosoma brucei gambiense (strain MHOM/CI/86/DAL972) TaxID=679716 RepID=C9ZTC9_TRYB9|nr:hypothetical protein, unlikely [Trypanosoma brucei gambiense DAL972]CBH12664.1 hypothetical protein, unlikely [Trypanosoma brucei gambiense DAL972]|eukprot:XP_011774944.1 hypothetical protein, unlikely [Trypanosoma brucei gambiense DAL972]
MCRVWGICPRLARYCALVSFRLYELGPVGADHDAACDGWDVFVVRDLCLKGSKRCVVWNCGALGGCRFTPPFCAIMYMCRACLSFSLPIRSTTVRASRGARCGCAQRGRGVSSLS